MKALCGGGGAWAPLALMLASLFVLAACATPYSVECRNLAVGAPYKYTEQQKGVACSEAMVASAVKEGILAKQEDGTYAPAYDGVSTGIVRGVLKSQANDIDQLLTYNSREGARQIDWFAGLRSGLEHQERITHAALDRFSVSRVLMRFTDEVGAIPRKDREESDALSYFFPNGIQTYSIRLFYSPEDVRLSDVPFSASYLNAAKEEGTLTLVDEFTYSYTQEYAEKVPDLYEANEFSWKSEKRGWYIRGYKIVRDGNQPQDGTVHYLEIFRQKDDGAFESEPAVRGFLPSGGSAVQAYLLDYDREGETGYGQPDEFWSTSINLRDTRNLITRARFRKNVLKLVYDPPERIDRNRQERQKPRPMPVYTRIVPEGEVEIDIWEKGSFEVPFPYRSLEDVRISVNKIRGRDGLSRIDEFVRTFRRDGTPVVHEYWAPKEEFSHPDIVKAGAHSSVTVQRQGGLVLQGSLNYFTKRESEGENQGSPRVVDYYYGGLWFRGVDRDGDGMFERRREIAEPSPGRSSSRPSDRYDDVNNIPQQDT